jgi:hypothetical protein
MGEGRLVSKRCLRVNESVATRLTRKDEADSLPLAAMKRCNRMEHIKCYQLDNWEGCPDGLKSPDLTPLLSMPLLEDLDLSDGSINVISPLSNCKKLTKVNI